MFKLISNTKHNLDSVQIWQKDDIIATVTRFSNGLAMVSLKDSLGRHGQHTTADMFDGNVVNTLLNHFAKQL